MVARLDPAGADSRQPAPPEVLDQLAIILTEADAIADGEDVATAIATIEQAAHLLRLVHNVPETSSRLTTYNGELIERYRKTREWIGGAQ